VRNREISYISEGRRKKVKERRKKEEGKCNPSNDFSD
jgi:hypothetical protein